MTHTTQHSPAKYPHKLKTNFMKTTSHYNKPHKLSIKPTRIRSDAARGICIHQHIPRG